LRAQQKITAVAAKDRWEPDPVRSPQQARRAVDTSDVWRAAPRALGVLVLLVLVIVASRMMMDDPQSPQGVSRAAVLTAPQAPDISGWRVQPPATTPVTLPPAQDTAVPAQPARQAMPEAEVAPSSGKASLDARIAAVPAEPTTSEPADSAAVVAAAARSASTPADAAPQPEDRSFAWPEAAVKCPRTWIAGSESAASGDPDAACHEFGALPANNAAPELEAAAEAAAPVEVARLPLARPASPPKLAEAPKARSTRATKARGGGLGPPPNCGSKRARWRYTDRKQGKRVWFCK
jgi:hypothetical protein